MKKSQLNKIKNALRIKTGHPAPSPPTKNIVSSSEKTLLKEAYIRVTPLPKQDTYQHPRSITQARKKRATRELAISNAYSDSPWSQDENASTGAYQPGMRTTILKSMRRKNWIVQAQLDLHGMRAEEAEIATLQFLKHSQERGLQRLRIIHGKGLNSPNQEPVLKQRICRLLCYQANVLAFTHPSAEHGGDGVLLVLVKKTFDQTTLFLTD